MENHEFQSLEKIINALLADHVYLWNSLRYVMTESKNFDNIRSKRNYKDACWTMNKIIDENGVVGNELVTETSRGETSYKNGLACLQECLPRIDNAELGRCFEPDDYEFLKLKIDTVLACMNLVFKKAEVETILN